MIPVPVLCMPTSSPLRLRQLLDHHALELLGHVDDELLHRLQQLARASSACVMTSGRETHSSIPSRRISSMRMPRCSSPRPETFTPSGAAQVLHAQRDVDAQLALQPLLDLPQRHRPPSSPGERAGVDEEEHRDGRLLDLQRRQGGRSSSGAEKRVADVDLLRPGDPDDVAGRDLLHLLRSSPRVTHRCVERAVSLPVDLPVAVLSVVVAPARGRCAPAPRPCGATPAARGRSRSGRRSRSRPAC